MRIANLPDTERRILAALTLAIYALVLGWSFVGHQHAFPARHAQQTSFHAATHEDGGHDANSCPVCAFASGSNACMPAASPSIEAVQAATPAFLNASTAPRIPFAAPANPRAPPAA